jgi:GMP synthase-like glutamine amidotransferase
MPQHFLVFQHTEWEGPGRFFLKAAERCGIELTIIKLWQEKIPSLSLYDALVVLGGKPNVSQEEAYPFLKEEKRAIKKSLTDDRPYFGICLGHQLLADALGATIGDNYCVSVGFVDGFLTGKGKEHPLFNNFPPRLPLFKWHCQTVLEPTPRSIEILATSSDCQIEAISVKGRPHIVGVQFDNNSSAVQNIQTYLDEDAQWLASKHRTSVNPAAIMNYAKRERVVLARHFRTLLSNFVRLT